MARTAGRTSVLNSRTSRARLKRRAKPHFVTIVPGQLSLGWRATSSAWLGRFYLGKRAYQDEALGVKADDIVDANGTTVLDFVQAQELLRARYAKRVQEAANPPARDTIKDVLERYTAGLKTKGGDKNNAARVRLHLPDELGSHEAAKVQATELRAWRDGLAQKMPLSTVNRIVTGLKAALNADLDPRIAANRREWQVGLRAFEDADESRNAVLTLPEPAIRRLIEKAAGEGPEFGLLVEVLAVTGGRYDQVARLEVKDLQDRGAQPRLMMPVSKKGRGLKKIKERPVPIPASLAAKLRAAVKGRPMTERLLLRASGAPWKKSDHARPFKRIVKAAELGPEVTSYALRHSSIVRQFLKNVPGRVIAAHHDTSLQMLERVYSAYIADHADDMTRAALLDMTEEPPALKIMGQ
jgi:integrase